MEILSVFPMKKKFRGPMAGLEMFKQWVTSYSLREEITMSENSKGEEDDKVLSKFLETIDRLSLNLPEDHVDKLLDFHKNHRNRRKVWNVNDSFPDGKIADEYLSPKANYSQTKFTWNIPNFEKVKNYCLHKLGWSDLEIQSKIAPIIDILSNNSGVQTRMESYFQKYDDGMKFARVKSKRLLSAFQQSAPNLATTAVATDNDVVDDDDDDSVDG